MGSLCLGGLLLPYGLSRRYPMRRAIWFLAMYTVVQSRSMTECWEVRPANNLSTAITVCDRQTALDLAAALNYARARRVTERFPDISSPPLPNVSTKIYSVDDCNEPGRPWCEEKK